MFENLSLVTRKSLPRHSKMRCERVEPSRTKSINARGLKLGRSDVSTAKHVRYSSHFCGKRILGCTTHQKMVRKQSDSEQPSQQSLSRPEVSPSVLGAIGRQYYQTCAAFVTFLRPENSGVVQPTKRWCERRVAVSRVQGSRSMRPKFRNTNKLILHVLDSCVKLLAVLHISNAQCQSVDLYRV